jgi:hypothetical protein
VCVELGSLFKKLVVKSSKILNPVIVRKVNCKSKRCVGFKAIFSYPLLFFKIGYSSCNYNRPLSWLGKIWTSVNSRHCNCVVIKQTVRSWTVSARTTAVLSLLPLKSVKRNVITFRHCILSLNPLLYKSLLLRSKN